MDKQGNGIHELGDPSKAIIDKKISFVLDSINHQLSGFEKRKDLNRKRALILRIIITILGALVTILLGLKISNLDFAFSNSALVISGAVTVLNTLEIFFNNRSLWIRYTATSNYLHSLKDDIEYIKLKNRIDEQEIDDIYRKYSTILQETNEEWVNVRKDDQR